jgi:hypothetical protein
LTLSLTLIVARHTTAFSRMQSGELVAGAPLAIREAVR